MSGSVFSIGSEPRLTAHDAETLARFLELAGSERAFELSGRIRHGNTRGERITLDRDDLDVLLELFRKAPDLLEPEFGLRELYSEVVGALGE
jgi:hypothetical protein